VHLHSTATGNNAVVLDGPADDHDGVVEGPLDLVDELIGTTTEDKGAALGLGAAPEDVEPLATDLDLLELGATSEVLRLEVIDGSLDGAAHGLDGPHQVGLWHPASAEDSPVRKVLGGQVANGELGKDALGARVSDLLELVVDDLPLGINDGLVLADLVNPDLGIVSFVLELELNVEAEDLWLLEFLEDKFFFFKKEKKRKGVRTLVGKRQEGRGATLGCCSKPAYEKVFSKATPSTRRDSSRAPPLTFFMPIMLSLRSSSSMRTESTTSFLKKFLIDCKKKSRKKKR